MATYGNMTGRVFDQPGWPNEGAGLKSVIIPDRLMRGRVFRHVNDLDRQIKLPV